jgi:release factor glutamine methyltransferase
MKINNWLKTSTRQLIENGHTSARLDALMLLELVLHKERSYILAHLDDTLNTDQLSKLSKLLIRRIHYEPLAYIRGFTEFYGRNFLVTPQVLIPRPESETIITMLKSLQLPKHAAIADIGTGSGALSITAALELPSTTVDAYDISNGALHVARKNAEALGALIHCIKQDLLTRPLTVYDVILANLPYVAMDQPVSKDTKYEPSIALYSEDDGLNHINRLIEQLDSARIRVNGFLIIEAEPRQHNRIIAIGKNNGFSMIQKEGFCVMLQKHTN